MKNNNTYSKRRKLCAPPVDESPTNFQIDLTDLVFYRDFHRFISRYGKAHISATEFSVFDMIFDRTIGWGKLWESISLNQFRHGVWTDSAVYSDGTGLGKRTIQRALEGLLKKGLIWRKGRHGYMARYALNVLWKPPELVYRDGVRHFNPEGSAFWWQKVVGGGSAATTTVIQRNRGEGVSKQSLLEAKTFEVL